MTGSAPKLLVTGSSGLIGFEAVCHFAAKAVTGKRMIHEYVDKPREGDHICYISDLGKMRKHYPGWRINRSLDDIFE